MYWTAKTWRRNEKTCKIWRVSDSLTHNFSNDVALLCVFCFQETRVKALCHFGRRWHVEHDCGDLLNIYNLKGEGERELRWRAVRFKEKGEWQCRAERERDEWLGEELRAAGVHEQEKRMRRMAEKVNGAGENGLEHSGVALSVDVSPQFKDGATVWAVMTSFGFMTAR